MVGSVNGVVAGLEVSFRAFWREARGGGGRLRQATETAKQEKEVHMSSPFSDVYSISSPG